MGKWEKNHFETHDTLDDLLDELFE